MVVDNKSLGCFKFEGILFMFVGCVQIEVIFDIDVNGILYVIVKEKISGKELSIIIENIMIFDKIDVECMVQEVEQNVVVDKQCKEKVEKCNNFDSFCVQVVQQFEEQEGVVQDVKDCLKVVVDEVEEVVCSEDDSKIVDVQKKLEEEFCFFMIVNQVSMQGQLEGIQVQVNKVDDDVIDVDFKFVE